MICIDVVRWSSLIWCAWLHEIK